MAERPKVLILGGGFGGLGAAKALKDAEADVVLVDRHDYHTFQPLLYQVATDLLEPATVGHPLRDLFHEHANIEIHQATVTGIDLEQRRVSLAEMAPIDYDVLVLALGAVVNFFGVEGADKHAFPLYSLPDATRLKKHLLERWEAADRDRSLIEDGALNVVVVGGGPTGVESAGAVADLYRKILEEDFPTLPADEAKVILVEAGAALVPMFRKKLQAYTKTALEGRGVVVRLGETVERIDATRVRLKSGTVLNAHTLIWGAGLRANPIVESLGLRLEHGGRVAVQPDLSVPGHPEVFVSGDIGWIADTKSGDILPQLGSVALQSGEHVGKNVARRLEGKDPKPFKYLDKGTMATIGHRAAVVQLPHGRTMKGTSAWLAWGAVHLALLSTDEARARALVDWTWEGFTSDRPERIVVDESE